MRITPTCLVLGLLTLVAAPNLLALDWPQWRGPQRDGTTQESGLLKEWPSDGPRLLWRATEIGSGYATPVVVGDTLYLLANEGLENEFVRALSAKDGTPVWSTRLGQVGNPKQQPNFPAARSTPTVVGDLLYALGSDGDLACLETATGKVRWQKHLRRDFGGEVGEWAYAESPLVDGDTLVCAPGGKTATVVALNRRTGEVIWRCALPEGDQAAYASAIILEQDDIRHYVHLLQKGLVGIEAKSGKVLWRYGKAVSRYNANIPTPLASEGRVFVASAGTGAGLVRLRVSGAAVEAEEVYFESKLPTAIGGSVKIGGLLFGTTGQALLCADFATGQVKWEERALGPASLCFADGRLYLHGENGEVALVEPSVEGYREKGRFTPSDPPKRTGPMEKAWAYPVIAHGRLYVRDHGNLWCYDVRQAR